MKRNILIIVGICCMFLFGGQVNAQKEEYKKNLDYVSYEIAENNDIIRKMVESLNV